MRAFIHLLTSVLLLISACSQNKEEKKTTHDHTPEAIAITYTCPMHPQVIRYAPGQCPICGMDLVPKNQSDENRLVLTENQIRLANITTLKLKPQPIEQTIAVNARLVVDQNYSEVISSRISGRVEKLFYKETGRQVKKGEPLYDLYSESLLTLEKEYLLAKEQYEASNKKEIHDESLLRASEKKLLRYGLSENQVKQLGQSKQLPQRTTFLSPASGLITAINASEGQYVTEGTSLYKIENLHHLWLEADLYPHEASLVKVGDRVTVQVNGYESSPRTARISFLSPEYRDNTQIMMVRADLENSELTFIPGTQAQLFFSRSTPPVLIIPADAVIRGENGMHVYIQSGTNTFQPRKVKTGVENFDRVEITEGLTENEIVVVSGAYLLYSELVLKNGINPMDEYPHAVAQDDTHPSTHTTESAPLQPIDVDPKFSAQLVHLLPSYLMIKDALVESDVKSVHGAGTNFLHALEKIDKTLIRGEARIKWIEKSNTMTQLGTALQKEIDLEKQRILFSDLTNLLYISFKEFAVTNLHAYYQYCPMAFDNKGAYWISREQQVSNPYFGKQMLRCGEVKETLK